MNVAVLKANPDALSEMEVIEVIIETVTEITQIPIEYIRQRTRTSAEVTARRLAMVLMSDHAMSQMTIGHHLHRDHTTVGHCLRLDRDAKFSAILSRARSTLRDNLIIKAGSL